MDLKTFIAETLRELVAGIREAQSSEEGGNINAESYGAASGHLMNGGTSGMFTRVDFDVAVSAETSGSGRGGVRVFGVGVDGQADHKTGHANRISFSVPVRIPDGNRMPRSESSSRSESSEGWSGF
jgi:hypothetical protein